MTTLLDILPSKIDKQLIQPYNRAWLEMGLDLEATLVTAETQAPEIEPDDDDSMLEEDLEWPWMDPEDDDDLLNPDSNDEET